MKREILIKEKDGTSVNRPLPPDFPIPSPKDQVLCFGRHVEVITNIFKIDPDGTKVITLTEEI